MTSCLRWGRLFIVHSCGRFPASYSFLLYLILFLQYCDVQSGVSGAFFIGQIQPVQVLGDLLELDLPVRQPMWIDHTRHCAMTFVLLGEARRGHHPMQAIDQIIGWAIIAAGGTYPDRLHHTVLTNALHQTLDGGIIESALAFG